MRLDAVISAYNEFQVRNFYTKTAAKPTTHVVPSASRRHENLWDIEKKNLKFWEIRGGEYIDFGEGEVFIFGRCFFIVCFQKKPERPFETMCFASLILQNKMDTNPNESVSNPGFGIRIQFC